MSRRHVLAAGLVAAIAVALTAAVVLTRPEEPGLERPSGPPIVVGGTQAERALARRLLKGFGPRRRIARVEVGVPPRGFDRSDGARWLTVTAPGTLEPASRVEAEWHADVLLVGMRRNARLKGWRPFRGLTSRLVLPDSDVNEGSHVAGRGLRLSRRPTRMELVRLIERSAARARVRVDEVWFLRPDALAVGARLITDDAETFVCESDERLLIFVRAFVAPDNSTGVEGLFLEVRDERGKSVLAFGGALGGLTRVRDDLWERYPPRTVDPEVRERYAELCGTRSS